QSVRFGCKAGSVLETEPPEPAIQKLSKCKRRCEASPPVKGAMVTSGFELSSRLHVIDKRAKPIGDVLSKVGTVVYRLELPDQLSHVHSTFHVSNLMKCFSDEPLAIPLSEIQIDDKLYFIEEPIEMMDRDVIRLIHSRIPIVKVHWNSRRGPEFTWERENQMQKKYHHLFVNPASTSKATS
ncbi:hypothetical protein Tco_0233599, partial [Tanacetum coccineum]